MDYKEKYEQALERAKIINPETADYEVAVKIFPELQESESEKIRKELIHFVRRQIECHDKPNAERDEIFDSWITWLEKQGELIEKYEDKLDRCACSNFDKGYKAALEKQGEQKPAWSEEDEQQMKSCLDFLDNISCGDDSELNDCRNWLKSLKERMKGE